jgi:hypothetical protein
MFVSLFRFFIETESFNVSIEPKQTEDQPNSLIRSIFAIFYRKFRVFPVFSFFCIFSFFCFFLFVSKQFVSVLLFYTETESFDVSIETKQTEDPPKQFKSIFGYFSENLGLFQFVSVCYETVLFVSVVSISVRNTETNRNF